MSFEISCNNCSEVRIVSSDNIIGSNDSTISIDGGGGYDGSFGLEISCKCGNEIGDEI